MQIPILNGVYTGENADFKTLYPLNMMPVIQETGISSGYLRPVEGITQIGEGAYVSRGAINWNGVHYRVMGAYLCSITEDGVITQIGEVGNDGLRVNMAYSFDLLAIASNNDLFYYYPISVDDSAWSSFTLIEESSGFKLIKVTDEDLGDANTVTWVDGYFMTSDGEYLVVTELDDPTEITTTKYGSSEIDPDPIENLYKVRNEIYAVNRYTIEIFDNIGGDNFPFQRIEGAQIHRGALGAHCSVVYEESIAFLGSGRNEAPALYIGANAQAIKISTREIDEILLDFSEEELSRSVLEAINNKSQDYLWVRLKDRTLVYAITASKAAGQPIWHIMSSSISGYSAFRARDVIFCYDKWQVGDTESPKIGTLDGTIATHFGEKVPWEFGTQIIYNESKGALIHSLELVAITGRANSTDEAVISTAYSKDGRLWSQEKYIEIGVFGSRLKRLLWRRQGSLSNMRIQRFRGDSNAYIAIARLEAEIEPLSR
jgi:hypothetical protein